MSTLRCPLGSVMIDIEGLQLSATDRARLAHPAVGGVILFTRNYASTHQLRALTAEIHALRSPALWIAVDHEGGRVQRFRDGFTQLPAAASLGTLFDRNPQAALQAAEAAGYVLAHELLCQGVEFSFTPVLDLDVGQSAGIGTRALHADADKAGDLAAALIGGLHAAGMAAVGKHFPGHGYASADSHHAVPIDERTLSVIEALDLRPYRRCIAAGMEAVMPAHIIYPAVAPQPAGFSPRWLGEILRRQLGFRGLIFSDDLSMEGASVAGDVVARAQAAYAAGCDMVLLCNAPEQADRLLQRLPARAIEPGHVTGCLARRGRARFDATGVVRDDAALRVARARPRDDALLAGRAGARYLAARQTLARSL